MVEIELERQKLKRERLNLKKKVDKFLRKWTIIYSSLIAFCGIATIFSLYNHWNIILSLIFIINLTINCWSLAEFREKCNNLYKDIEKMKEKEDEIMKKMKLLCQK